MDQVRAIWREPGDFFVRVGGIGNCHPMDGVSRDEAAEGIELGHRALATSTKNVVRRGLPGRDHPYLRINAIIPFEGSGVVGTNFYDPLVWICTEDTWLRRAEGYWFPRQVRGKRPAEAPRTPPETLQG